MTRFIEKFDKIDQSQFDHLISQVCKRLLYVYIVITIVSESTICDIKRKFWKLYSQLG